MAHTIILTTTLIWVAVVSYSSGSNPVPIPSRPYGIKYDQPLFHDYTDPLLLEVFLELACKDAKQAFDVYLDVARYYNGQIQLVFYQFPLPYHRAAMHGSQTLRIVTEAASEADAIPYDWQMSYLVHAFDNQDLILDRNLVNKTEMELIRIFAGFAEHCGVEEDDFLRYWNQKFGNKEARAEFKYGCSRGVSGTPYVFLNGVFLTNNHTWTLQDYKNVIEPLVTVSTSDDEE